MKYRITAKNPNYCGYTGNCLFNKGVCETEDEKMLHYFKSAGYTVEEIGKKDKSEDKGEKKPKKNEDKGKDKGEEQPKDESEDKGKDESEDEQPKE